MRDLIAERLSAGSPTTTCVLIPCIEDLHSRTTFPQPPFDQAEIIQAMDGEIDVAQRVDVQLVGNPCMLRINEILVGICTADPIRSLSSNEASRCPGDRLTRLVSHIVQQRSFYPLFPPAEGCQMSTAHVSHLGLQQTPDILLLPSMLNAFTKRVGDVLCVNPGKLTRGSGPGTFARLTIHPIVRHLRSGPAGGSRKVTAGLALSPSALVDSPDKAAEGDASETAATVPPQQLSQNFESAASADTKPKDGDINAEPLAAEGEAAQAEGDSKAAAAGEDKVESSGAPAPDDKMEVDGAAAAKAEGEGAAAVDGIDAVNASSDKKAPAHVRKTDTDENKAEVAHRVCERTRVDLVRI
jgi:hypothetical protein